MRYDTQLMKFRMEANVNSIPSIFKYRGTNTQKDFTRPDAKYPTYFLLYIQTFSPTTFFYTFVLHLLSRVLPPLRNRARQILKHSNCAIPVNARICNTDTLLERSRALGRHLLVTLVDI